MIKNRVAIFIDGGNFHHLVLKKLGISELEFNFEDFASFLANGRPISNSCKRYYIGTIREKEGDLRSKQQMARQTKLFAELTKHNWIVYQLMIRAC